MNTAEIEKSIKMLNNGEFSELADFLQLQRTLSILNEKGSNTKQITAIAKVLKNTKYDGCKGCQHTIDGKQFISDGYFLVLFKEYNEALDGLKQISSEKSMNTSTFFKEDVEPVKISSEDFLLLNNIQKFYSINKKDDPLVYMFGKWFSAHYLSNMYDIVFKYADIQNSNIYIHEQKNMPVYIDTQDYKIILLPCRFEDQALCEVSKKRQDEFLSILSNN